MPRMQSLVTRGQSITEFAVLIGAVILALAGMNAYVKRGVQGAMKGSVDDLLRVDDADATGVATQQKGIEYVRPRVPKAALADDAVIAQHDTTVSTPGDIHETYAGRALTVNGQMQVQRTGFEIYHELAGSSKPKTTGAPK